MYNNEIIMIEKVNFINKEYKLIFTLHAYERMKLRNISREVVKLVIEGGLAVKKSKKNKWWVYKKIKGRTDNDICVSINVEDPKIIVITALINWRPK